MVEALRRPRLVVTRHEQAAAFVADAWPAYCKAGRVPHDPGDYNQMWKTPVRQRPRRSLSLVAGGLPDLVQEPLSPGSPLFRTVPDCILSVLSERVLRV